MFEQKTTNEIMKMIENQMNKKALVFCFAGKAKKFNEENILVKNRTITATTQK